MLDSSDDVLSVCLLPDGMDSWEFRTIANGPGLVVVLKGAQAWRRMRYKPAAIYYIRKEDVTPSVLEKEKAILREQIAASGKPAEMVERIVAGKLGKFYEDYCLYEQRFIKDLSGSLTVGELIASKVAKFGENIMVRRFARFKVGEGSRPASGEETAS